MYLSLLQAAQPGTFHGVPVDPASVFCYLIVIGLAVLLWRNRDTTPPGSNRTCPSEPAPQAREKQTT
jgi:hypothetical protein